MTSGETGDGREALLLNLELQVQNLRHMTQVDLQIFGGFLTLQLAVGGYLAEHAAALALWSRVGLAVIDVSLAGVAIVMLALSKRRRSEVVGTLRNINTALGFETPGRFVDGAAINAPTRFRPWLRWYIAAVVVSIVGFMLILFAGGRP